MVETIKFRPVYIEDLALGTGTVNVELADGSVVALTKVNLTSLAGGVASAASYIDLSEQASAPGTPGSSTHRIYIGTDGYFYRKNSAGTAVEWPDKVGTVSRGTWQGTAVGVVYGGTGLTSATAGDLLYASAANTIAKLAIGTNNYVLKSNGTVPSWAQSPFTAVIAGRAISLSLADTYYFSPYADGNGSTSELYQVVWPKTGTFSALYALTNANATGDMVFTVRVQGAATSLTATVSAGTSSANDTVNTASITAGQYVSVSIACASATNPAVSRWGFVFTE